MIGNAHALDLTLFIGAAGSGKTTLARGELRARPRLPRLIWSWKETLDRYAPEFGRLVEGRPSRLVELAGDGESVVYVPDRKSDELIARQFDFFCGVALDLGGRVVLVEELSVVANSRSSPKRWQTVITEGRGYGLVPMAATQRPQFCDAASLDAATAIYCGRLNKGSSHKIMADTMGGLPVERVRGLAPLQFLLWRAGVDGVEQITVTPPKTRRRRR